MVRYADNDITIRVKGAVFGEPIDTHVTFRQGKKVYDFYGEPEITIDGEYVTCHLDRVDSSNFYPTDTYNAEPCEAIVNWWKTVDDTLKHYASTIVNIPVQANFYENVVNP